MELTVKKDGRFWISELTIDNQTVRTIHSPPSIFYRKRDATEFNNFITNLVGNKTRNEMTYEDRQAIKDKLKEYDKPYDMA